MKGRIQSQIPGTDESVGLKHVSLSAKDFRDRGYKSVDWHELAQNIDSCGERLRSQLWSFAYQKKDRSFSVHLREIIIFSKKTCLYCRSVTRYCSECVLFHRADRQAVGKKDQFVYRTTSSRRHFGAWRLKTARTSALRLAGCQGSSGETRLGQWEDSESCSAGKFLRMGGNWSQIFLHVCQYCFRICSLHQSRIIITQSVSRIRKSDAVFWGSLSFYYYFYALQSPIFAPEIPNSCPPHSLVPLP